MAFTYNVSTDRGKVRLLISDTDSSNAVFDDDEIDTFLTMEASNVLLAAARALDVIAANEAMVLKVIKLLDVETDGAKLAKELRATAESWRAQADDTADVAIAEYALLSPTQVSTHLRNELLRST